MSQRRGNDFFRVVVEASTVAVVVLDAEGLVRYHTAEAARLLRGPDVALNDEAFWDLLDLSAEEAAAAYVHRLAAAEPDQSVFFEGRCRLADGDERWIEVTGVNLLSHPDVGGLVLNLADRTELASATAQALTDPLTGLANRRALLNHLNWAQGSVALMVDLDNFKAINDRYGHQAGDDVLVAVARRLSSVFGPTAVVGRIGGDEFLVLLPESALERAWQLAEVALASIEAPIAKHSLHITASIGITHVQPGEEATAVERADQALYAAKAAGRAEISCPPAEEALWKQRRKLAGSALGNALREGDRLKVEIARLSEQVRLDDRTGLLNAQAYAHDIAAIDTVARQEHSSYALALCDIDYFKNYNSRYLYAAANRVLRTVADALKAACRPGDLVYRYGGEELVVVLKDANPQDAITLAERLRQAVEDLAIPHENRPAPKRVTISVGVAALDANRHQSPQQVLDEANNSLLDAKHAGRNLVKPQPAA